VRHDPPVTDLSFQLDVSARLLIASVLGAAIGFEREVHGHPAGMRTHLLVSMGSALFTVLSIHGFPPAAGAPLDPSRVAAQIVSGIGFLGAGAIIKDGFSIRGLTTAASLWATAAVGMSAGASQHLIAIVATAIVLFSLWPLNRLADRVRGGEKEVRQLRLEVASLEAITGVSRILTEHQLEILSIETWPEGEHRHVVDIGIRVRSQARLPEAIVRIDALESVESLSSTSRQGD
jgi:putative Mg2+ transporter-C (MgtC) family protein